MASTQFLIDKEFECFAPEDRKRFEEDFYADPDVKRLKAKANAQAARFQLIEYQRTQEKIRLVLLKVLREYKKTMKWRTERIDLLKLGMEREPLETIKADIVGIHLACDVLESFCNEIKFLMDRNAPGWRVDVFDNILRVGSQATEQIDWIIRNTDLLEYDSWGNECDKFVRMLRDKAAKLMRLSAEGKRRKAAEEQETNKDKEV